MEEFYKTIEVGQKVKICGITRRWALCEAVVAVTGLYRRPDDYGFDYLLISGQAYDDIGTVGHSELMSGKVTVYPYDEECRSSYCECEEGQCSVGKVDMRADEASKIQKNNDVVNSPNHYILFKDIEVKDVVKEVLRRWQDESNTDMSFNQAGMMKEALQYLLRAPKKNKKEDVEKAVYYLKAILEEWE
jgi:hypothetical protein